MLQLICQLFVGVTRSDWKVCCLHYRLRWVGRGSGINSSLNVNQEQGKKVKTGKKKAKTEARKSQGLKKQEWQKESVTNGCFSFKSHPFLLLFSTALLFIHFDSRIYSVRSIYFVLFMMVKAVFNIKWVSLTQACFVLVWALHLV